MAGQTIGNASTLQQFRSIADTFSTAKYFALCIPQFKGFGNSDSSKRIVGLDPILNSYARSFALPGAVVNSKPVNIAHGLPQISIADSITFAPWTVTFIDDNKLNIRKFFETWLGTIRSWEDHSYFTPFRYKANGSEAAILDDNRRPIHVYQFFGMYPTDISPITVGQDNNSLIEFSVVFQYDYYKPIPIRESYAIKSVEQSVPNPDYNYKAESEKYKTSNDKKKEADAAFGPAPSTSPKMGPLLGN